MRDCAAVDGFQELNEPIPLLMPVLGAHFASLTWNIVSNDVTIEFTSNQPITAGFDQI
jgi:hypothetical protein